jgi:hypothetical protein
VDRDSSVFLRKPTTVTATKLTEPITWQTAAGDTLPGAIGDWLVISPEGGTRTVTDPSFRRTHVHIEGDTWKRVGTVTARRATATETIVTTEGETTAQPGDWVVTDTEGASWPVRHETFTKTYRRRDRLQPFIEFRGWPFIARALVTLIGAAAAGLLTVLVAQTTLASLIATQRRQPEEPLEPLPFLTITTAPTPRWDAWFVVATIATAIGIALLRRRQPTSVRLGLGFVAAFAVIALGAAAYTPCVDPSVTGWLSPVAWVLTLFAGDLESATAGQRCAAAYPPGLGLARSLGVLVTASSAASLVLSFARGRLQHWRVRVSGDVDVVIGLSTLTLPLAQALVDENHRHQGRGPWVDLRPGLFGGSAEGAKPTPGQRHWRLRWLWWWLTGLRPGDFHKALKTKTNTVVIDPDPDNPLIALARRNGILVLTGDAADTPLMRGVLTRWRPFGSRRASLRRLYAVSPSPQLNLQVWEVASQILGDGRVRGHLEDVVPRIFVLMEDAREARQWRAAQLHELGGGPGQPFGPGLVSDAITLDGIAAEVIAERLLPASQFLPDDCTVKRLIVVGQGSLSFTLLDEISWQQWCRFEIADTQGKAAKARLPALTRVALAGPKADVRGKEWITHRAPWSLEAGNVERSLAQFEVDTIEGDPERQASDALTYNPSAVVVFVDDTPEYAAMAARLARAHPTRAGGIPRVVYRTMGGSPAGEAHTIGGMLRMAPSLVRVGTDGHVEPPQDSVTALARQQHAWWSQSWPTGRPSPNRTRYRKKWAGEEWSELADFFREDNIRQHWHILSWFSEHGYRWTPITAELVAAGRGRGPTTTERALGLLARSEYERWRALRLSHGWWLGKDRHDSSRLHKELDGWDLSADREANLTGVTAVVTRLWATGLVPVPQASTEPQNPPG